MSDSNTPDIEKKKKETTSNSNTKTTKINQWGSFGKAILSNIVISIIYGFIGANFIFFTTAPALELNKYFPVNMAAYSPKMPAADKSSSMWGGATVDGKERYTCRAQRSTKDFNMDFLKQLGFGGTGISWPYRLYKNELVPGVIQRFENWFSKSVADTFIMSRKLIQWWLKIFSEGALANETLQMFVVAPITLFVGHYVAAVLGFFGYIYNSFKQPNYGWAWSLLGLLFGYTTFIALMTMIVEVVKFIGTFLVLPAMANYKLLGEIIKCNAHSVAMLFGAMTVSSASTYLDSSISTSMMVVYIILLIKSLFF
jgi:hypothetical protein